MDGFEQFGCFGLDQSQNKKPKIRKKKKKPRNRRRSFEAVNRRELQTPKILAAGSAHHHSNPTRATFHSNSYQIRQQKTTTFRAAGNWHVAQAPPCAARSSPFTVADGRGIPDADDGLYAVVLIEMPPSRLRHLRLQEYGDHESSHHVQVGFL